MLSLCCGEVNVSCDLGDFSLVFFACSSFVFVVVSCLNVSVDCKYGCEGFTHPWEGREPWVKGISWA